MFFLDKPSRKGRPCKPGGPTERKRLKQLEKERLLREKDKEGNIIILLNPNYFTFIKLINK